MSLNEDDTPIKSYELVTDSLVRSALEKDKGPEAELLSFKIEPFTNKGDNYSSIVTSVLVQYRLNGSEYDESYVAKLNPLRPGSAFTEILENTFGLETDMFSSIAGGMNEQLEKLGLSIIKTPKLFARCLEKGQEGFLTENLRKKGFRMYDRRKGMDLIHSTLVMKELGRFHASSLLFEETLHPKTISQAFDYFKDFMSDVNEDSFKIFDAMMSSHAESCSNILKNAGPKYEESENWLRNHRHEMGRYFLDGKKPHEPFNVLIHGDCWTNNMLFKYNEDNMPIDIRFVDLQCSRKASPSADLNYFFYSSLNGELLQTTKMDAMIDTYYEAFREVLDKSGKTPPFSIQELKEELDKGKIFGLCCALLILPPIIAEGDEIWSFDNCNEDELEEFLEIQKEKYKKLSEKAAFKDRFLAVFDALIERNLFE